MMRWSAFLHGWPGGRLACQHIPVLLSRRTDQRCEKIRYNTDYCEIRAKSSETYPCNVGVFWITKNGIPCSYHLSASEVLANTGAPPPPHPASAPRPRPPLHRGRLRGGRGVLAALQPLQLRAGRPQALHQEDLRPGNPLRTEVRGREAI